MSATTAHRETTTSTSRREGGATGAPARHAAIAPIPLTRLIGVELSKMFDTRAGFWLIAAVGILSLIATVSAIAFVPDGNIVYDTFAQAIGIPMAVILPIIAILSVTGEYSQRTALSTYTLVPRRGRVVLAKAFATIVVGITGMLVALGVGALGNVVGAAITGVDTVWNSSLKALVLIVLANLLGMAVGFMLGVVIRHSQGAIVAYFVYSLVLPGIFGTLAAFQAWFTDLRPWVDVNFMINSLYENEMTTQMWTQLGVTSLTWIVIPTAIGLRLVMRSEVK